MGKGKKTRSEETPENVRPILNVREEPAESVDRIRWLVPQVAGPAYAHAALAGAAFTLCKGIAVGGAVYPPASDVPRCSECSSAARRLIDG